MTQEQQRRWNALVRELHGAVERLSALADDVSLDDYREGSYLSHAVDAVEGALRRYLVEEVES